jgi:two-component system sensor histidine kinase RegB
MAKFFKSTSHIQVIIALCSIAIAIQLLLIIFVNLDLAYQLLSTPLVSVISLKLLFTLNSNIYYRRNY